MLADSATIVDQSVASFHECMDFVHDPRMQKKLHYPLNSMLFLVVCGVLANADGPSDIEKFGNAKFDWITQYCDFPKGIPSHDTISRVLAMIDPDQFDSALATWYGQLVMEKANPDLPVLIAIDGKTVRGSAKTKANGSPLHLVSAWASEYGLSLGQVATSEKSNEITAIPRLLEKMDIEGGLITIDAMGCQRDIAEKIIDQGGDYLLAVKGNQPKLLKLIKEFFESYHGETSTDCVEVMSTTTESKGHGRVETRHYYQCALPASLWSIKDDWCEATSIGQAVTVCRKKDGSETSEVRYYLVSRDPDVFEFARGVRGHWGIESMHWVLDVVFLEDGAHIRKPHEVENMSIVRKLATSILKRDTSSGTLKGKRKRAGYDTDFLDRMLFFAG